MKLVTYYIEVKATYLKITKASTFGLRVIKVQILFSAKWGPPHFALTVRALLNLTFSNRWIGRPGVIDCRRARQI